MSSLFVPGIATELGGERALVSAELRLPPEPREYWRGLLGAATTMLVAGRLVTQRFGNGSY
jgi:hypothetical protein